MKVLICKQNEQLIQEIFPSQKLTFEVFTKNTCTFNISTRSFDKLVERIKEKGYNPYALLTW